MRNTLTQQIAWARGRAVQARRQASAFKPEHPGRRRALDQADMAEAVALSLESLVGHRAHRCGPLAFASLEHHR